MAFLSEHLVLILSVLLAISEILGLAFPAIGGVLGAVKAVLKAVGAKELPKE